MKHKNNLKLPRYYRQLKIICVKKRGLVDFLHYYDTMLLS